MRWRLFGEREPRTNFEGVEDYKKENNISSNQELHARFVEGGAYEWDPELKQSVRDYLVQHGFLSSELDSLDTDDDDETDEA